MKKSKILLTYFCVIHVCFFGFSQIDIDDYPLRTQYINQYTSVFVSSPKNNTIIQSIHDDSDQDVYLNSDRFYIFDQNIENYTELEQDIPTDVMQPGVGYVLTFGGNGNHNDSALAHRALNFSGGVDNNGTIDVTVISGKFCLLGNPYNNFLDLDSFLLNPDNIGMVTGPIYLWSHNTIISANNINPSDPNSDYRFSANDYAMYNVLGGCASGRSISTSPDTGTSTGIQIPNGRLCFGTGFGIITTNSGDVTFTNDMRTNDNGGAVQSFKNQGNNATTSLVTPPNRHRIWVNIEKGVPPTTGTNSNPLKQLLVGYSDCYVNGTQSECPTNGDTDRAFDAATVTSISNPEIEFYSLATTTSAKHLAIQGRNASSFTVTDFFQLGYTLKSTTTLPAEYTFTSTADGMFDGSEDIHYRIWDNGMVHNFPYTATLTSLTDGTRFRIVFQECEETLHQLDSTISISSSGTFNWSVQNLATNNLATFTTGNSFSLTALPNTTTYSLGNSVPFFSYGTSYLVTCVQNGNIVKICKYNTSFPNPQFSQCGQTLAQLNSQMVVWTVGTQTSNPNYVNLTWASAFKYELKELDGTLIAQIIKTNPSTWNSLHLTDFSGFTPLYNHNYQVCISVRNTNGIDWLPSYCCQIATPLPHPYSSMCGTTLSSVLNDFVVWTVNDPNVNPNYVSLSWVAGYKFQLKEVDGTILTSEYATSGIDNTIKLTEFPGFTPLYNHTYQICISVKNSDGSTWFPYSCCLITTPTPLPVLNQCNGVLASDRKVSVNRLTPNTNLSLVTGYRYELCDNINFTGTVYQTDRFAFPNYTITLNNFYGFTPIANTTYFMRVAAFNSDGNLIPVFGPICQITPSAKMSAPDLDFDVIPYPNPFNSSTSFKVTTISEELIEIVIYDMIGKMIEKKIVDYSEIDGLQIGNHYAMGIYNVTIKQGEFSKSIRIIKN